MSRPLRQHLQRGPGRRGVEQARPAPQHRREDHPARPPERPGGPAAGPPPPATPPAGHRRRHLHRPDPQPGPRGHRRVPAPRHGHAAAAEVAPDNQSAVYGVTVHSDNNADRFLDLVLLDVTGQTVMIAADIGFTNYFIDEPGVTAGPRRNPRVGLRPDPGAVGHRIAGRLSGGPFILEPGPGNLLLAYSINGSPSLGLDYYPRWWFDRADDLAASGVGGAPNPRRAWLNGQPPPGPPPPAPSSQPRAGHDLATAHAGPGRGLAGHPRDRLARVDRAGDGEAALGVVAMVAGARADTAKAYSTEKRVNELARRHSTHVQFSTPLGSTTPPPGRYRALTPSPTASPSGRIRVLRRG